MSTPTPTGFDAIIEALQIFRKYSNPDRPFHCEHDILYVMIAPDEFDLTTADQIRLAELGFEADHSTQAHVSVRFGSA